jgi:ribulose-5-phosphate 4-epimerase/fuculose-1-phosphate aldolase
MATDTEPKSESAPDTAELAGLYESVATACQIMAEQGLVENILGHISVRTSPEHLLVRCRGPLESGLAFTTADDIREVSLAGTGELDGWTVPAELPIHTTILKRRADVTAVVHAHPPSLVALSLLDVPLVPIYGAYDIPGAHLAADGIPVWERSALINNDGLAAEMADALGPKPVVILRGHGLVSVAGGSPATAVATAVLQAIAVETLARTTLTVLQAGGRPRPISSADLAALPDLGRGLNVETLWRYLQRRAAQAMIGRS